MPEASLRQIANWWFTVEAANPAAIVPDHQRRSTNSLPVDSGSRSSSNLIGQSLSGENSGGVLFNP